MSILHQSPFSVFYLCTKESPNVLKSFWAKKTTWWFFKHFKTIHKFPIWVICPYYHRIHQNVFGLKKCTFWTERDFSVPFCFPKAYMTFLKKLLIHIVTHTFYDLKNCKNDLPTKKKTKLFKDSLLEKWLFINQCIYVTMWLTVTTPSTSRQYFTQISVQLCGGEKMTSCFPRWKTIYCTS